MIKTISMLSVSRLVLIAFSAASVTSCQTLGGLMNTLPFRMLDDAGGAAMGLFSENTPSVDRTPGGIQKRASDIQKKGTYAGKNSLTMDSPSSMALR
jgi:hypothetical protein